MEKNKVLIKDNEYIVWDGSYHTYYTHKAMTNNYERFSEPLFYRFPLTEEGLKAAQERAARCQFKDFWSKIIDVSSKGVGFKYFVAIKDFLRERENRRVEKIKQEWENIINNIQRYFINDEYYDYVNLFYKKNLDIVKEICCLHKATEQIYSEFWDRFVKETLPVVDLSGNDEGTHCWFWFLWSIASKLPEPFKGIVYGLYDEFKSTLGKIRVPSLQEALRELNKNNFEFSKDIFRKFNI